jgi:hypothetical protein
LSLNAQISDLGYAYEKQVEKLEGILDKFEELKDDLFDLI